MQKIEELIKTIDAVLPQTQCTRCGYPSCLDYATAVANNQAQINQCPPGGNEGIIKLAAITGQAVQPLNPQHGVIQDKTLVVIDESACIGCTLCIKACPVDAIIGSNKMLHTVIASECTGCDLCISACPVDCMHIVADSDINWTAKRAHKAKARYEARNLRLARDKQEREARLKKPLTSSPANTSTQNKQIIQDGLNSILGNILDKVPQHD